MENPLHTPAMRKEIALLNENLSKSPFNPSKLMEWIRHGSKGNDVSPTAALIAESRRNKLQGGTTQAQDHNF
jgi:hypothetical protein